MKYKKIFKTLLFLTLLTGSLNLFAQYPANSPVALNGKLKVTVTGTGSSTRSKLSSECGNAVQLRGMSTHGISWAENCYTTSALDALVGANWKIDILRVAQYIRTASGTTLETGYVSNPARWKMYIDNLVDECGKRGIYCMIDWHVMGDPNTDISYAQEFWSYMSKKHAGKKHVLYEICNEPSGDWNSIKSYADNIINNSIRPNDPNTVIMVGTPFYSSQPNTAAYNKLTQSNIMYSLHFYAGEGSHSAYRTNGDQAIAAGVGVFVTEFGTSPATGTGSINTTETGTWINWMKTNNVSWCNWTFSDIQAGETGISESSAALNYGACATSAWTSLTASGTYISGQVKTTDVFTDCKLNKVAPTVTLTAPTENSSYTQPASVTLTATTITFTGNPAVTGVDFYATDEMNVTTKVNATTVTGSSPFTYTWTNAPLGNYFIKAVASTATAGVTGISSGVHIFVNVPQAPYLGTAWPIPGKIEAENFDVGGMMNAYYDATSSNEGASTYRTDEDVDLEVCTDAGGGNSVGYTAAGEWIEYMVDVKATNIYNILVRLASGKTNAKKMRIELDGVSVSGTFAPPSTGGYQNWQTVTISNVSLTAGTKVMRVFFETGDINFNYVQFDAANVLPTVAITSPSNNSTYTPPANVSLSANASDASGIKKVEFFQKQGTGAATSIGVSSNTSQPYLFSWTNVPDGTYIVTARATDNSGGIAESSPVTVIVNSAPTVSIIAPVNNATYTAPASVSLQANASDAGSITKVEFFQSQGTSAATSIGVSASSSQPYIFSWTNVPDGTYKITAKATDNAGGITESSPITIVVNSLPTVSLTAPSNNAVYTAPANINLQANASDLGSITKVEFFQSQGTGAATSIGVSASASQPYLLSWTNVTSGTYKVIARATDNLGGIGESSSITIVVNLATGLSSTTSSEIMAGILYPNPSSGSFNLKGNEDIKNLVISNMLGAQVAVKENVRTGETFDLGAELEAGTYSMHVFYTSGKTQIFKLIKTQ